VYVFSFLFLLGLGACVSTQHQATKLSPVRFTEKDRLLVLSTGSENSYDTFREIKKICAKRGIEAKFYLEEEWVFKSNGILNPTDSQYFDLLQQLGYKYLLTFGNFHEKPADSFLSYYTGYEVSLRQSPFFYDNTLYETSNRASIDLFLISMEENKLVYTDKIETSIGAVESNTDDGGEYHVNLSDTAMATAIAIKKGVKKMLRNLKNQ